MRFIFLQVLSKRIKAIKYFIKDKEVPKRKKFLIIAGILYLLLPIDFIPEPILLFGVVDDIVLWTFILWYLKDELDRYWIKEEGDEKSSEKYRGKNIIDDVNFEVEDNEKEVEKEEEHK